MNYFGKVESRMQVPAVAPMKRWFVFIIDMIALVTIVTFWLCLVTYRWWRGDEQDYFDI